MGNSIDRIEERSVPESETVISSQPYITTPEGVRFMVNEAMERRKGNFIL